MPKSLAKIRNCIYPFPVYEAHFSDKTYVRLSFHSPKGKPLAVDRARGMVEQMTKWTATHLPTVCHIQQGLLTGKTLVRGYVEHDQPGRPWMRYLDPHFAPHAVPAAAHKRITAKAATTALADLVKWLDGNGPDDALKRARKLIAA